MNQDKLLTQREVCRLLGVSPTTLQILRRNHKISYVRFGHRTIRFSEKDVVEFMRESARKAEANS